MFLIETFLKIVIFHTNVTLLICTTVPHFSDITKTHAIDMLTLVASGDVAAS